MRQDLIRDKMNQKGISVMKLSEELGLSKKTMYNKLQGNTEFTLSEVRELIQILNIENIRLYFNL